MKRLLLLLLSLLTLVDFFAQGIKVFKKDGTIHNYYFLEIDSIVAYSPDELPTGPNGREAVELGLSVRWANMNVGAAFPEDYGDYFAWGETEPKEIYNWSTYKWCSGDYNKLIKYCIDSHYGSVDNKSVLEPDHDAAHENWGGAWRMPSTAEVKELLEKCTWIWTRQNDVNGYKVTGPSGNFIFIPAAGVYYDGNLNYSGLNGRYLSNSINVRTNNRAIYIFFNSNDFCYSDGNRCEGLSVRPVCP